MAECRGFKNKLGTTIVSLIAKVTGAVAGNIATFNNDGELVDSGKSMNSFVEKKNNVSFNNIVTFDGSGDIKDSGKDISTLDTLAEKVSILEEAVENLPQYIDTGEEVSFPTAGTQYTITFGGTISDHYAFYVGDKIKIKGLSHSYSYLGTVSAVNTAPYSITTEINLGNIPGSAAKIQVLK